MYQSQAHGVQFYKEHRGGHFSNHLGEPATVLLETVTFASDFAANP